MSIQPDTELATIITQAKAGDATAFGELYSRYAGLILRYLYIRLHEQESAQDLTQEVFVRVIKGIAGLEYRGEKSFLGWLYTIASNVLIGHIRRKRAISTPLEDNIEVADPHGQDAVHSIFDRVALAQAMTELTEDQQHVLTLKFFADMTNQEIALLIGRTEGAIKALQYRALHALQHILERECETPNIGEPNQAPDQWSWDSSHVPQTDDNTSTASIEHTHLGISADGPPGKQRPHLPR